MEQYFLSFSGMYNYSIIQGFQVKEGLSCVLFRVVAPRKTRNLALP